MSLGTKLMALGGGVALSSAVAYAWGVGGVLIGLISVTVWVATNLAMYGFAKLCNKYLAQGGYTGGDYSRLIGSGECCGIHAPHRFDECGCPQAGIVHPGEMWLEGKPIAAEAVAAIITKGHSEAAACDVIERSKRLNDQDLSDAIEYLKSEQQVRADRAKAGLQT